MVRATQDRTLVTGLDKAPAGRLFVLALAQPSTGHFTLVLRDRPGQTARKVPLQVNFSPPLVLRARQRPETTTGKGDPTPCATIRVWDWEAGETDQTTSGLEWLLLSDQPTTNFNQALTRARQYTSRWLIVDFYEPLETGQGGRKVATPNRHTPLCRRHPAQHRGPGPGGYARKSRLQPDLLATAARPEATFLQVLTHRRRRPVQTVRDVNYTLASLGGHLDRKGDRPPSWQALWREMMSLRLLVEGVRLATQLNQF